MSLLASVLGTGDELTLPAQIFWGIGWLGLFLIILQAIFGIFVGHDGDASASSAVDLHGGHGGGASVVSLKTVSAMLLGFGFGGALMLEKGFSVELSACGGIGIGLIFGVAYFALMNSLYRLKSDGTASLTQAIDRSGTVYLRIPGNASGSGEIQVSFGGRLQNVRAFTRGQGLATGTAARHRARARGRRRAATCARQSRFVGGDEQLFPAVERHARRHHHAADAPKSLTAQVWNTNPIQTFVWKNRAIRSATNSSISPVSPG